jgi:hypothetical protein
VSTHELGSSKLGTTSHVLSKSSYVRGCQCPKALYYIKNRRDLLPPTDPQRQAIFDAGNAVGLLAQQLFLGGVDCRPDSPFDYSASYAATQAAVARGERVIYEAAFLHDGVMAALDILVRTDEGWKAYEVKSSGSAKPYHVTDAALQAHVIEQCGVPLVDVSIVHMNNKYVRAGEISVPDLFTITSIREAVAKERLLVPQRIEALKAMLATGKEPEVAIGPHCDAPFECDFKGHCWAAVPTEQSVLTLTHAYGNGWDLFHRGVERLAEVPDSEPLSAAQRRQVDGWKNGRTIIDGDAIRSWLATIRYPLYHFDFETFAAAVPPYDNTRPYQQIPFQYSIHRQDAAGAEPVHRSYLGSGEGDPREALVLQMLDDLGDEGDILTYHASFERSRIEELARDLPRYATALLRLVPRIQDLETPFLNGWYYAPEMNGRTSIKQVLPAVVLGSAGYKDLVVQEGGMASLLYRQLSSGEYKGDVDQLRIDLLAYCERDTMAMVRILEVLKSGSR